jgi:hypothetical protein
LLPLLLAPQLALAHTTYILEYSGAPFGNLAQAHGTITFSNDAPPNPSAETFLFPGSDVSDFALTVLGASHGNGTFRLADYEYFSWNTKNVQLDLSLDLIGQVTVNGLAWASEAGAGGFGLGAALDSGAPTSLHWYVLATNEGLPNASEHLRLTSFRPVPVPPAFWLFAAALGSLFAFPKKRKATSV